MNKRLIRTSVVLFPKIVRNDYPITLTMLGAIFFIVIVIGLVVGAGGTFSDTLHFITTSKKFPNADQNPTAQKWAEIFLGLAFLWPLVLFFLNLWRERLNGFWFRLTARDHVVICGLGWTGRAYIANFHQSEFSQSVAAVEINANESSSLFCKGYKTHLIRGNAGDSSYLTAAAVHRAKRIYVCSGTQDENLRIAEQVKAYATTHRSDRKPLELIVSLSSELTESENAEYLFHDIFYSNKQCSVSFYDADERMARLFFHQHKVYQWAHDHCWQSEDSPRVHLVFLGFSRLCGELIRQYSRIWPCDDHRPPLFSVITRDTHAVVDFQRRNPILCPTGAECQEEYPGFSDSDLPCQFAVYSRQINQPLIDVALMEKIDKQSSVTAVFCSTNEVEATLNQAAECRRLSQQHGHWRVPIFVQVDQNHGTQLALKIEPPSAINGSSRIIPFGSAHEYCDVELLGYLDNKAKKIHENYVKTTPTEFQTLPANQPWSSLDYIYKKSNHRAADHIPVKLTSLNYRWTGPRPTISATSILEDPDFVLAELEHRSWLNEKLIAGFRHGAKRDDQKKLHPDILPWTELTAYDRQKDVAQVEKVEQLLKSHQNGLVRRDHPVAGRTLRIGFLGPANINAAQASVMREQSQAFIGTLDESCTKKTWVDLVGGLSAGSECALVDGALSAFPAKTWFQHTGKPKKHITGYRLLVPVVENLINQDAALKAVFLDDGISSLDAISATKSRCTSEREQYWSSYQVMISEGRKRLLQRASQLDFVHLKNLNDKMNYIANQCDMLVVGVTTPDTEVEDALRACLSSEQTELLSVLSQKRVVLINAPSAGNDQVV